MFLNNVLQKYYRNRSQNLNIVDQDRAIKFKNKNTQNKILKLNLNSNPDIEKKYIKLVIHKKFNQN